MIKQVVALIGVSIGVIVAMPYSQEAVQFLLTTHDWVSQNLTDIFSGGHAGNMARGLIALLIVPVLVGLIPAFIYWLVKRHWLPYFMEIVWVVWLIQAGALVVLYKVPV